MVGALLSLHHLALHSASLGTEQTVKGDASKSGKFPGVWFTFSFKEQELQTIFIICKAIQLQSIGSQKTPHTLKEAGFVTKQWHFRGEAAPKVNVDSVADSAAILAHNPSQFLHKKWVIHSNPDLTSNMVPGAIPLNASDKAYDVLHKNIFLLAVHIKSTYEHITLTNFMSLEHLPN
ncbi:hypothetical protein EB796_008243 [Bugula neritina]|uniref:Uncharacterized protein n=1 Tax=Bugula neritina TaxID=10212 RepID=A0A7J7K488_BUGNE|nr:hypothetical protein EB796_008243 [Bugula neritina]